MEPLGNDLNGLDRIINSQIVRFQCHCSLFFWYRPSRINLFRLLWIRVPFLFRRWGFRWNLRNKSQPCYNCCRIWDRDRWNQVLAHEELMGYVVGREWIYTNKKRCLRKRRIMWYRHGCVLSYLKYIHTYIYVCVGFYMCICYLN